jgi:hypothetical protein
MNKPCITLLVFLYFFSGIGHGSVLHYCHGQQEMLLPGEDQCCSPESMAELLKDYRPGEKQNASMCCISEAPVLTTNGYETQIPGNCCEILHIYGQPDLSSLHQISYLCLFVITGTSFCYHPKEPQTPDTSTLMNVKNPSTHTNLPLLI